MKITSDERKTNSIGIAWLLADTTLMTFMSVLVKIQGSTYPAIQLVFIRSLIGLVSVLPLAIKHWNVVISSPNKGKHALRVACNTIALSCNFTALTMLPLSLNNAISFSRPMVMLVLAAWLLKEPVSLARWVGSAIALVGVMIILSPSSIVWNWGLAAALGTVIFGSLAIIQIRTMANESTVVLMVYYTVGLTVFTAIPAGFVWVAVPMADWPVLLAIGILAQVGQYCFFRAYQTTPTRILAPLGYLSIIFQSVAGYLAFNEIPTVGMYVGIGIIIIGLQMSAMWERKQPTL